MVGITSYGAYIPMLRLPLAAIGGGKGGGPEKAVAGWDEDSVTMAVAAAVDCLHGIDRRSVDAVFFASTSYPFQEKQGAALVAKALDLRRDVQTADVGGSLRAGTNALRAAFDAVGAGSRRQVLVVVGDTRMAAPRTPMEANLGDERLPPEVETALYRLVQEALTNVVKHSRASRVSISLVRKAKSVSAVIEDDGVGFSEPPGEGLGLIGMRERVGLLDGRLEVESSAGQGTTIVAEVPL